MPCELRLQDGSQTSGQVVNLSLTGALLVLTSELPSVQQPVGLALREPLWQIAIETAGLVARVIHGHRLEDTSRGIGVRLAGLSGWHRYLFAQLLGQTPLACPTVRGPRLLGDPN